MDTFSLYTSNMSQTCILCGQVLATKYFSTRFVKVSVEKVPWLVDRLQVQVLPCVGCFIGGKLKHRCVTVSWRKGSQCGSLRLIRCRGRLIGFEELGNDDSFATAALELRLSLIGEYGMRLRWHVRSRKAEELRQVSLKVQVRQVKASRPRRVAEDGAEVPTMRMKMRVTEIPGGCRVVNHVDEDEDVVAIGPKRRRHIRRSVGASGLACMGSALHLFLFHSSIRFHLCLTT